MALLAAMLLGVAVPAQASLLDHVVPWFSATVRTQGLAIAWDGTITARRIALRDAGGTWATLEGVTLRWAPLRLLHGALEMRQLLVRNATLERLPHSASRAGGTKGGQGGDPLPERVALRTLTVERLTLAPALTGTTVALRIEGAAWRRSADNAQARLLATEIGGSARYRLQVALAPSGLQARLTAREPPGGPLGRLVGLPPTASPGLAPISPAPPGLIPILPAPPGLASVPQSPQAPVAAPPTGPGASPFGPAAPPSATASAPTPSPGIGGPLALVATAAGPLAAVAAEARLTLGAAHANARGTVDLVHQRMELDLSAATPAMAPRPDVGWTGARLTLHLGGAFAAPEASGQLDLAGLAAAGVRAHELMLRFAGTAATARLHGQLDDVRLPGRQPEMLAAAPVRFTARLQQETAGHRVDFTVEHPLLQASGRMEFAAAQHLTARLTVPELAPFSVLAGVAAQGQASLAVTAMREAGTTHIALDGRLGLTGGPAAAITTLGSNATIAAAATYTGAGLALQRLQIIGQDLTFDAHGAIAPARLDLVWQAALARLEPLDRRFAGHVNAAGRVFGPADNLALTAD
ncbi:MAG: hypothetical protein ACREFY_01995, partial [Acetobacteraceae bacterium]